MGAGRFMRILQIISCILACASVASIAFVGAFCELVYITIPIALAVLFAVLMVVFKRRADPPLPPRPDFMNSDAENKESSDRRDEK